MNCENLKQKDVTYKMKRYNSTSELRLFISPNETWLDHNKVIVENLKKIVINNIKVLHKESKFELIWLIKSENLFQLVDELSNFFKNICSEHQIHFVVDIASQVGALSKIANVTYNTIIDDKRNTCKDETKCLASTVRQYSIDENGNIHKCWKQHHVLSESFGSLQNDKGIQFNNLHYNWLLRDLPTECKNCDHTLDCMGGCFLQYLENGKVKCPEVFNVKS